MVWKIKLITVWQKNVEHITNYNLTKNIENMTNYGVTTNRKYTLSMETIVFFLHLYHTH